MEMSDVLRCMLQKKNSVPQLCVGHSTAAGAEGRFSKRGWSKKSNTRTDEATNQLICVQSTVTKINAVCMDAHSRLQVCGTNELEHAASSLERFTHRS